MNIILLHGIGRELKAPSKNSSRKLRNFFILLIFIAGSLLFAGKAEAATYYVDATLGKDTYNGTTITINDGTNEGPWKTIAKVNAYNRVTHFVPGDLILFKRGESWSTEILRTYTSGTSGNPITFGAYGTGNNPIIQQFSMMGAYPDYPSGPYGAGYWLVVQDLDFSSPTGDGIYFERVGHTIFQRLNIYGNMAAGKHGMNLTYYGSHYSNDITIQDCVIHNNADRGIYGGLEGASIIRRNVIYSNGSNAISMSLQKSGDSLLVEHNTIYNNSGYGFGSSPSAANTTTTVQYNDIYSNGSGIIFHGNNLAYTAIIQGNLIHNNTSGGIDIGDSTSNISLAYIYNNTFTANGTYSINVIGTGSQTIKNNVMYSNGVTAPQMYVLPTGGGTLISDNNVITDQNGNSTIYISKDSTYKSMAQWKTYNSNTYDQATVTADPLVISVTDYELQPLSTAIDSGTTTSSMTSTTTDFAGRPIYGTPDIGAYEYQPPFTLGSSLIDSTGNIRIYGDGKYRYTTATSSTMSAHFSVAPAEGLWSYDASTTRPEWLNISNITWGTTKQWTASSSVASIAPYGVHATTTVYTIGDLTPNAQYTITVDGVTNSSLASSSCSNGLCTAGSDGKLILTYTGGYSTHTFAVAPYTAPTPTPSPTPQATVASYSSSGGSASSQVQNLMRMGNYALANKIAKQYNIDLPSGLSTPTNSNPLAATNQNHTVATAPNQTAQSFQRTLKAGMSGNDVKALQVFLNAQGFMIAKTGVGSPGHETHYFGPATKAALIKFQNANADTILKPQGLTEGTGFFGEGTRRFIKERY